VARHLGSHWCIDEIANQVGDFVLGECTAVMPSVELNIQIRKMSEWAFRCSAGWAGHPLTESLRGL